MADALTTPSTLALPISLDADRACENFVISDAKGGIVALVPGEPNYTNPHEPPDDPEMLATAQQLVALVNAFGRRAVTHTTYELAVRAGAVIRAFYYCSHACQSAHAQSLWDTLPNRPLTVTAEPEADLRQTLSPDHHCTQCDAYVFPRTLALDAAVGPPPRRIAVTTAHFLTLCNALALAADTLDAKAVIYRQTEQPDAAKLATRRASDTRALHARFLDDDVITLALEVR